MSHPGFDDQPSTPSEEPVAPAFPATVYPPTEPPPPSYPAPAAPVYVPPAQPAYQAPTPTPEPPTQPAPATPAYAPGAATVSDPAAQQPSGWPAQQPPAQPPGQPGQPVPSAPTYDPTAVTPYSAQPYSGYAVQPYPGQPISGPYGYGVPMMSAMPAPAPPKRSRAGLIILSIATAVLLASTGVLGTLFAIRNQDANDLANQVTTLSAESKANKDRADGLQKDLDGAKRDLTDAKAQTDQITQQRTVLADCINAILDESKAFNDAGGKLTDAVKAKEADTDAKCTKAQSLL